MDPVVLSPVGSAETAGISVRAGGNLTLCRPILISAGLFVLVHADPFSLERDGLANFPVAVISIGGRLGYRWKPANGPIYTSLALRADFYNVFSLQKESDHGDYVIGRPPADVTGSLHHRTTFRAQKLEPSPGSKARLFVQAVDVGEILAFWLRDFTLGSDWFQEAPEDYTIDVLTATYNTEGHQKIETFDGLIIAVRLSGGGPPGYRASLGARPTARSDQTKESSTNAHRITLSLVCCEYGTQALVFAGKVVELDKMKGRGSQNRQSCNPIAVCEPTRPRQLDGSYRALASGRIPQLSLLNYREFSSRASFPTHAVGERRGLRNP
ncbi:hypothetical protein Bbelb_134860 [Branchiostoma belcheri]|nr:hypothetical protein Bbelb_134860 [Branchiostoma belcheri]